MTLRAPRTERLARTVTPREPAITCRDDGTWQLDEDVTVVDPARVRVSWASAVFVVPAGFVTDLASIPRALWSVLAPFELSITAPIAHDWAYKHAGRLLDCVPAYTRAEADALFLSLMTRAGVSRWRRTAAYLAVRAFGASSWRAA